MAFGGIAFILLILGLMVRGAIHNRRNPVVVVSVLTAAQQRFEEDLAYAEAACARSFVPGAVGSAREQCLAGAISRRIYVSLEERGRLLAEQERQDCLRDGPRSIM